MTKLIFGCGYLGSRVAKRWQTAGHEVHLVTRSHSKATEMAREGYVPLIADIAEPSTLKNLPSVETVLFAVGYDRNSSAAIYNVYRDGLANVLAALPGDTGQLIYISTTGVYGPAGGDWIDEQTPASPQRDGGKASLAAEQVLAEHSLGKRSVVLRLAGIYGPGRIPYVEPLRRGEPLAVPSEGWLNLVHVDDAAEVVLAVENWSAKTPEGGPRLFCVSDGNPVIRGDYYREVARRIEAAPPQFIPPDPDTPAAARARSDKRIDNGNLIRTLNFRFSYPSYREGLVSILGQS